MLYTTSQIFWAVRFCSPSLHLFDQKYSKTVKFTEKDNFFQFEYILKCNLLSFQSKMFALLQSHNPSKIILIFGFAAQKNIIIKKLKTAKKMFRFLLK